MWPVGISGGVLVNKIAGSELKKPADFGEIKSPDGTSRIWVNKQKGVIK